MKISKIGKTGYSLLIIFLVVTVLMFFASLEAVMASSIDITATVGDNGVISIVDANGDPIDTLILHNVDYPSYTGPWCPGLEKKGLIRIVNKGFSQLKLSNLGLKFDDSAIQDNFELTLIQNAPQSEYLNRNEYADFSYTVKMKEDASKGLQGSSGILYFTLTLNEIASNNNGGGSSSGGSSGEHWAHDCITSLIQHNIINSDLDIYVSKNFENIREKNYKNVREVSYLDGSITRGEIAVFLGRALKLEEKKNGINPYNDEIPDFARGYIISTFEAGVYRGYPDYDENGNEIGRIFLANKNIPRQELCCVLIRAFNKKVTGNYELAFKDKGQIQTWALQDVKAGVQNEVIVGFPDNTFRPMKNTSRAEFFSLLCRLMGYHSEHNIKL